MNPMTTDVTAVADAFIPVLDLQTQYAYLHRDITKAIDQVLRQQHFVLGPQVKQLEEELARFCGVEHGIGVASGTDALILALRAAGIGPGDEVIVPAFSFIATADAVSLLGATPVFADVEPDTLNLDMQSVAARVTERTRAVVPVHLYGQPAAMGELRALAAQHQFALIEDAAQALGATWNGEPVCGMGDFGCTSFFPSKNLGGCGDGGMIFTRSAEQAERLRMLRSHGSRRKYHNEEQGWNSRLDEIQAAILRVKLPYLQDWNAQRRQAAALYTELLAGVPGVETLAVRKDTVSVFHQFTVRVPGRDRVQREMTAAGIQTMVYYPIPLHLQAMYRHLGYQKGDLPVAEAAAEQVLSLPMFPEITAQQCERVVNTLRTIVSGL